jgi:hypothetical protein
MKKLISCIFCFLFYYFVLLDLRSCSALRGSVRSRPPSSPRVGFSSCFCVAGLGSLSRSVVAQDSVFAAKSFPCRLLLHGRLLLQAAEPDLGFASISRLADRFWSFVPHRFPRLGLKCCILEPFTHGDFLRSASGFAVPVSPPAFGPKPLVRYLNPPPPAAFSLPHF